MKRMKNYLLITAFLSLPILSAFSQKATVVSPNQKIQVSLFNQQNENIGEWYLRLTYIDSGQSCVAIPQISLGLIRSDQDFSNNLKLLNTGKPLLINEKYTVLHGKRSSCSNSANELTILFENSSKAKLNLIIRVYNDGVAFRYGFPDKEGSYMVKDELTSYNIPSETKRWMERFDLSSEVLYSYMENDSLQQEWGYPALFNTDGSNCWYLIHEADVNRSYCASRLSNTVDKSQYKITFPASWEGDGKGESQPTITLPWESPWRVIIMGNLTDIVESTLIKDVSPPSLLTKTDWIKPGIASWNYWSNNHGTKDYKIVCEFADLAAEMNWPYTLLDWEWDQMGNGGKLEDALNYIQSKGVKPLMWYNSGASKYVPNTPRDRMLTHESRIKEFSKLQELGVAGVKIDFFWSEKQNMINFYLDILDDAAQYQIMVYFHGCIVPRGWSRTYPHLMTYEGIRGAEWYNNGPELTTTAPEHNTVVAFTRNVVGAMDYTPVTFTNSQYPHITSYGHELALSVVFESGIQHFADRPEGYLPLPDAPKSFLKEVPSAWDDTRLLDGYPGKDILIARRKGDAWYIGGINSEDSEQTKMLAFNFLPEGAKYKLTLIADGKHDKDFETKYMVVDKSSTVEVEMLRRGGFVASLKPIE
jgi:alpha-glucosidase